MWKFDFSLISKFRSELMGIAAIGILICHAGANKVALGPLLPIFNMGQLGNALFFMLSGFGLYFSLSRTESNIIAILKWYKKRLVRILVPYLFWCIPFFLYQLVVYPNTNWLDWIYVFSLLSYWDGSGGVAWFLSVLIALYVISPLLYKALLLKNKVSANTIVFAIISLLAYCFSPENVTIRLICSNMPNVLAFILGMAFGVFSQKGFQINVVWFFVSGLIAIALYYINKAHQEAHMFHFGSCLLALPLLYLFFRNVNHDFKGLRWIGKISLESYLTNGALPRIVVLIPWGAMVWLNTGNYLGYTVVVIGGLLLAWVIHMISQPIIKIL